MAGYQEYLDAFTGVGPNPEDIPASYPGILEPVAPPTKADQLEEARQRRLEKMGQPQQAYDIIAGNRSNNGVYSRSEEEWDFANLSPNRLAQKYGVSAARKMNLNRLAADSKYRWDAYQDRSSSAAVGDSLLGAGQGLAGLFGLGALGVGLVDDEAGITASREIQKWIDKMESLKSLKAQGAARVVGAENRMANRDNLLRYQDEIAEGADSGSADLRYIGREILDSGYNILANPTNTMDIMAQGAGSLGSSVFLGKLAGALGKTRLGQRAGAIGDGMGGAAGRYVQLPAAIAAQEAGGAYQGLANEAMQILEGRSDLTDEEKYELANAAALEAAALQAPVAAVTGRLVARFEAHPLRAAGARGAAKNIVREITEESIQGASGEFAGNVAIQDYIDPDINVLEGVGTGVSSGAIGALGSTGGLQAAGLAGEKVGQGAEAVDAGVRKGLRKTGEFIEQRAAAIENQIKENAPLAAKKMRETFSKLGETRQKLEEGIRAGLANVADPSAKLEAMDYVSKLTRAGGLVTLAEIETLASEIENASDEETLQTKAAELREKLTANQGLLMQPLPTALQEGTFDPETDELIRQHQKAIASLGQSDVVMSALTKAQKVAEQAAVDVENLTPGAVESVVSKAETKPLDTDANQIDTILKQSNEGAFTLTPRQKAALLAARAQLDAAKAAEDEASEYGISKGSAAVSAQITVGDRTEGKTSGAAHMRRILTALQSGNIEAAKGYYAQLAGFAQAMQNKVSGINEALSEPGGKQRKFKYQTRNPNSGELYDYEMNYTPEAPKSVRFTQQIAIEARAIGELANRAAALFPELEGQTVELASLDPRLVGPAAEVAQAFAEGRENERTETKAETVKDLSKLTDDELGEITAAIYDGLPTEGGVKVSFTQKEIAALTKAGITPERGVISDDDAALLDDERAKRIAAKKEGSAEPGTQETEQAPQEATEQVEPEATQQPAQAEPDSAPVSRIDRFKNLLGSAKARVRPWFKIAFKEPKKPISRLADSSLEDVYVALGSQEALEEFIGKKLNGKFSQEISAAYQKLIADYFNQIEAALDKRLNDWLDSGYQGKTIREMVVEDTRALNRNSEGKILNITTAGELVMDPDLKRAAILAALQWAITANNQNGALPEEAAAAILGVRADQVDGKTRNMMAGRLTAIQVVDALTRKITQYWGVQPNSAAPIGYTQGIPGQMARELITVMQQEGLIKVEKAMLSYELDGKKITKTPNLYQVDILGDRVTENNAKPKKNPIRQMPDAIDQAVLIEPETLVHVGKRTSKVARTQLRNKWVKLSSKQVAALENEANTEHKLDMPMTNLVYGIGPLGSLILFGEPNVDSVPMNQRDKESIVGRNRVITSGWNAISDMVDRIRNYSEASGLELKDVPIFYDYEFSSVNRMQMQGDQNPQANKLMREVILPTRVTLDLTKLEHRKAFILAVAQAMGVKVHEKSFETIEQDVRERMAKLPRTQEILSDWLAGNGQPSQAKLQEIRDEVGKALTPVQLHAIVDYLRAAKANDKTAFETSLYLEADGVTNGPANAINLFDSGAFTPDGLENRRRVGRFFGNGNVRTTNDYRQQEGAQDLYTTAALDLIKRLNDLYKSGSDEHRQGLLNVRGLLSSVGIAIDRSLLKNPLTITVYGSGAKGIAGKLANEIFDNSYQLFSKAAQRKDANPQLSDAEAMFGDIAETKEQAEELYARFFNTLQTLTQNKWSFKDGQTLVKKQGNATLNGGGFTDYEFTDAAYENLQHNLLQLLVDPMVQVIRTTMGNSTMRNVENVRKATQAQSIIAGHMFAELVKAKIEEKKQNDTTYRVADSLSQQEFDEIYQQVIDAIPMIEQNGLTFHISNKASVQISKTGIARTFDEKLDLPTRVQGPANARVTGIPYLTIGLGDGMMMTVLATMPNRPQGTLKVFDGMHMRLTDVFTDAVKVNQAAHEAWQGNPMEAVAQSFKASLPAIKQWMGKLSLDGNSENNMDDFIRALDDLTPDMLLAELEQAAKDLKAKQKILGGVAEHVDQMAGAATPYSKDGEDIGAMSVEEQAAWLEARRTKGKKAPAEKQDAKDVINRIGRVDAKSGARVLSLTAIRTFYRAAKMTQDQRGVLNDILKTLGTNGYTVVFGSKEQVTAWQSQNSRREVIPETKDRGLTVPSDKVVYLIDPSSETLIHELIHAATFELVSAYYQGKLTGANRIEQIRAIQNLEKLMEQFINLGGTDGVSLASMNQVKLAGQILGRMVKFKIQKGLPGKFKKADQRLALEDILEALGDKITPEQLELVQRLTPMVSPYVMASVGDGAFSNVLMDGFVTFNDNDRPAGEQVFLALRGIKSKQDIRVLIHEMTHIAFISRFGQLATRGAIAGIKGPQDRVDSLLVELTTIWKEGLKRKDWAAQYGMSNLDEFVAEALTNPVFQQWLEKGPTNLWNKFVDFVRKLLGLSQKKSDLLSRTLKITDELIEIGKNTKSLSGAEVNQLNEDLQELFRQQWAFSEEASSAREATLASSRGGAVLPSVSPNLVNSVSYRNARNAIQGHLDNGNKAAALNEFMAWALANPDLQELGKRTESSSFLVQLAKDVVDGIKRLIWGRKRVPVLDTDMFTSLRFNTNVLLQAEQVSAVNYDTTVLYQSTAYGSSDRLTVVDQTLAEKVARWVNERPEKTKVDARTDKAMQAWTQTGKVTDLFAASFGFNMQELTTFHMMLSTMATGVALDANALIRAQELYAHVQKNLTPESFMPAEYADEQQARFYATEKYNLVMGKFQAQQVRDDYNRTTLLPAFMALATVSEEFRAILKKMPVPPKQELGGKTIDEKLDNLGIRTMDAVSDYLSGQKRGSKDVQAAVDNLMNRIVEVAADRQTFMKRALTGFAGVVDYANETVVRGFELGADWVNQKAEGLLPSVNNKLGKFGLELIAGITKLVDQDAAEAVSQDFLEKLYKKGVWTPFNEFISDIVGRNSFNGNLIDMIKIIRAAVQQVRQQYRDRLPQTIARKFTKQMESQDWTALYRGMAKTDLAALVQSGGMTFEQVREIVTDEAKMEQLIRSLEDEIKKEDPANYALLVQKSKQLAEFLNTGNTGNWLLTNAKAISELPGLLSKAQRDARPVPSDAMIRAINQVTSLYALQSLDQATKARLTLLALEEAEGFRFSLAYTVGQRRTEVSRAGRMAEMNHYKGYIPSESQSGVSLVVDKSDRETATRLGLLGYQIVGAYDGSSLDSNTPAMSYYFAPVSGKARFQQGLVQNVHQTAGGVDLVTGRTRWFPTAGIIRDPVQLDNIMKNRRRERGKEPLIPRFNAAGELVAAERTIDPIQMARLDRSTDFAQMLGVWAGRQIEEVMAAQFNRQLLLETKKVVDADKLSRSSNRDAYYDVFRPNTIDDPIIRDAIKLITPETLAAAQEVFGDEFLVPKTVAKDFFGYRAATIGDAWTGNTRWKPAVARQVRDTAIAVFGKDAYQKLVNGEQLIQNFVTDARLLIVVKSVVVPMLNIMSNMLQLMSRGVPMAHVVKGLPKKTAEVDRYIRTRLEKLDLEAELRAVEDNVLEADRLKAKIKEIDDLHRRLSIWPLIQAGELASISDVGISKDEIELSSGRLNAYIEKLVDKLPDSVRNAGRYAWITRDTALFKGLQRAVEYGDFLAKAVLYDDLTIRKKMEPKEAMAIISQEYVNYDVLPGRARGYMEDMGIFWFWTFKIRSIKIAASIIRNNPVHALLASTIPVPDNFGTVGSPIEDNLLSVMGDGRLEWSVGIDQGLRAPELNPWWNLTT